MSMFGISTRSSVAFNQTASAGLPVTIAEPGPADAVLNFDALTLNMADGDAVTQWYDTRQGSAYLGSGGLLGGTVVLRRLPDGTPYVEFSNSGWLGLARERGLAHTIAGAVRWRSQTAENLNPFVGSGSANNPTNLFLGMNGAQRIRAYGGGQLDVNSGVNLVMRWLPIVVTFGETMSYLHVDAWSAQADAVTSSNINTSQDFYTMGRWAFNYGEIDVKGMRVWDRELTLAERTQTIADLRAIHKI